MRSNLFGLGMRRKRNRGMKKKKDMSEMDLMELGLSFLLGNLRF